MSSVPFHGIGPPVASLCQSNDDTRSSRRIDSSQCICPSTEAAVRSRGHSKSPRPNSSRSDAVVVRVDFGIHRPSPSCSKRARRDREGRGSDDSGGPPSHAAHANRFSAQIASQSRRRFDSAMAACRREYDQPACPSISARVYRPARPRCLVGRSRAPPKASFRAAIPGRVERRNDALLACSRQQNAFSERGLGLADLGSKPCAVPRKTVVAGETGAQVVVSYACSASRRGRP